MSTSPFHIFSHHTFDLSHGFLPNHDPIHTLPPVFSDWEAMAIELPKRLMSEHFRKMILDLPPFDVHQLKTDADHERAMLLLSYLSHAYVWGAAKPVDRLPEILARPWDAVAKKVGRPPVLSYASYALYNWKRLNPKNPIALNNIVLLQNFLGGEDEEWFILIHVDIEAKAIPALQLMIPVIEAAEKNEIETVVLQLECILEALTAMCRTLDRMPERCDPYIYFNRVRPYIHGWKDNPALPNGLIYEGVSEKPLFLKGETGAQSSIIPCLDALFGVKHADNPLKKHLDEMNQYMPPHHRQFVEYVVAHSRVREFVLKNKDFVPLREHYNACLETIARFRQTHVGYAAQYIQKQHQQSLSNSNAVGTGGTPFMQYLQSHLKETSDFLV